jgi:hypothetical protein
MAIDEKESKELAKAQKGLNKKFTELTTRMGEVNGTLAKEAANLRKSSRDTFQGMLNARKLAKVSEAIANDMQLQQLGEHIDNLNEDNKELQKSHDDIIKEREDALKTDESLNTKREQLQALQMNLDTDIYTSKKAEKAAQESANALQRQINKEITDIQSIYAKDIETAALDLKSNNEALKEQQKLQAERMEMYSDQLEDASKDGNFSKFSDGLKELSGGTIDLGDAFDGVIKKFNAVKNIVESLGNFGESLQGLAIMMGLSTTALKADLMGRFPVIGGLIDKIGTGLTSVLTGIDTMFGFLGKGIMAVGRGIKFLITNPIGALKAAWKFMSGGLKKMGTGFVNIGKQFLKGAARMAISAATLVAGMLATAASVLISGIVMLAPAILIGLAIAGLILGIMYLAKKFEENKEMIMFKWGLIQEGFSIAIDGLILWKDKAVNFIGNVFEDIWMSIKSLFSAVLSGIENGINFAIQGINSFLPERMQLDEVDIGAKGMAAGLDEEKAALAIERDAEAVEFAERKDELDERKATVIENFKLDEVPKDGKPLSLENAQAANAMTGEGIATATTEVKQGEKQGNMVNVVNQSSSPTTVSNTQVHNASGSPRDTDRTAVGLNAIAV